MPTHIRRSLVCLSIDDPKLAEKAFESWADAIILDIVKSTEHDWQQTLQACMPAAIAAAISGSVLERRLVLAELVSFGLDMVIED